MTKVVLTRKGVAIAFQDQTSFAERARIGAKARERFPMRAPIIVQRHQHSDLRRDHEDPPVEVGNGDAPRPYMKLLVPLDMHMGALQFLIRRRLRMSPTRALFFFVHNDGNYHLVHGGMRISDVYGTHAADDALLYIVYAFESTFGG